MDCDVRVNLYFVFDLEYKFLNSMFVYFCIFFDGVIEDDCNVCKV